jgi:hypothetical protein
MTREASLPDPACMTREELFAETERLDWLDAKTDADYDRLSALVDEAMRRAHSDEKAVRP